MPWVNVATGSCSPGEVFYLTTPAAAGKSYILERVNGGDSDTLYWAEWKFGYYVGIIPGQPLRWVERSSKPCYGRRMNYFVAAQNDVQAFAVYLPRNSFFNTLSFILYRFD